MPIAIYERMDNFSVTEIQLQKGDQLYLLSDGFADQFGGVQVKKFKYKPFKELLLKNSEKTMAEQKNILDKTFMEWKGKNEQVDDVTVIGIKI
jgi:serine phosphatase RsbU (regulator of sigma subunit)